MAARKTTAKKAAGRKTATAGKRGKVARKTTARAGKRTGVKKAG